MVKLFDTLAELTKEINSLKSTICDQADETVASIQRNGFILDDVFDKKASRRSQGVQSEPHTLHEDGN